MLWHGDRKRNGCTSLSHSLQEQGDPMGGRERGWPDFNLATSKCCLLMDRSLMPVQSYPSHSWLAGRLALVRLGNVSLSVVVHSSPNIRPCAPIGPIPILRPAFLAFFCQSLSFTCAFLKGQDEIARNEKCGLNLPTRIIELGAGTVRHDLSSCRLSGSIRCPNLLISSRFIEQNRGPT